MSVSSVANFVTAVNAIGKTAAGNTYLATGYTKFPNGTASVTITQNGAAFLTVVYEGVLSQFVAASDLDSGGISVRWVGAGGVQKVMDAQAFINFLSAN